MKLFECQNCGQLLFFENRRCESCGHDLGFLPEIATLSALTAESEDGLWRPLAAPEQRYRRCANAEYEACNWLVPEHVGTRHCRACRLNRTIPDLSDAGRLRRWRKLEDAKHRLVYSLLRLDLPVTGKDEDPQDGLAFDFLSDRSDGEPVMTGHADGLITIDLAEADDASREWRRGSMSETYRTLLGHFRHEIGHYYWQVLVAPTPTLQAFRSLFGDERQDYGESLEAHHANGPAADWADRFVSAYASAHPWEDWAETWAHYMHIVDTLETAYAFGLSLWPTAGRTDALATAIDTDPHDQAEFDDLLRNWLPLTYAVNGLNRSMGQPDLYPFVLAPAVIDKLRFVHTFVRGRVNAA